MTTQKDPMIAFRAGVNGALAIMGVTQKPNQFMIGDWIFRVDGPILACTHRGGTDAPTMEQARQTLFDIGFSVELDRDGTLAGRAIR